jgi:hypothetical protein
MCLFGKGRGLVSLSICLPALENIVSKGFHEPDIFSVKLVKALVLGKSLKKKAFHIVMV